VRASGFRASGRRSCGYLCTSRNLIWVSSLFKQPVQAYNFFWILGFGGGGLGKISFGWAGGPMLWLDTSLLTVLYTFWL
jgi:hypothetical protein